MQRYLWLSGSRQQSTAYVPRFNLSVAFESDDACSDLRRLGQTTQIARSTLDQVRARIALLREKTKEASQARTFDFEKRLQEVRDAEETARVEKKRHKQEKNKPVEPEVIKTEEEDSMAAMMGFGGFGSSKK